MNVAFQTHLMCRRMLGRAVQFALLRSFLVLTFWLLLTASGLAGGTNSWRVFRNLSSGATLGTNLVANPGMETTGTSPPLARWNVFGLGYNSSTAAHIGSRALQCVATTATEVHGGFQTIVLNQTIPKPLKLGGWSKAQGVTGASDSDYSVYLDILYTNGTWLYGQIIPFSVGTHDWEYREAFIMPASPIRQISCYLLFRNSHVGTVWFDDISLAEVQNNVVQFDGAPVLSTPPSPFPINPADRFTLATEDGLQIQITQDGGIIKAVSAGTNSLVDPTADYASGCFVCDRGAGSDWWNVGGWVTATNGILQQQGVVSALDLSAHVLYSETNNAIRIQATISNLISQDRAISLYFALPVAMDGGSWWNSPRDVVSVTQSVESATFASAELGARNLVSQYPLATLAQSGAITLAVPPDQYRPFRLVYNRVTRQFFAVFDIGISSIPTNFPGFATVEVWLYRTDPAWGLRSGLEGFYSRFPGAFSRNFTNEGIWVAFADIHNITNIADFGIGYHEIGYNPALVKFDDTKGIQSFRYVSEPWSHWMAMPANISNTNYASVYSYLLSQHALGVKAATATLSSGLRNPNGLLNFFPAAQPWCPYGAAFNVNASPFITDSNYSTTKFKNEWNITVRDVYNHPENGLLDGEYIDSFAGSATERDYSSNHLRTTSFPLTYTRDNPMLMTPLIYGTIEMARALGDELHSLGKPIIGNTLFTTWPGLPVGIGLFDFAGTEMNCFDPAGNLIPPADSSLLYARALSGRRPYGYLLNTDFTKVSQTEMESYIRLCGVYAIYPSAFSANAASDNYFEQPSLYERDRSLFKKYVPIIRSMSLAGWQPVTDASPGSTNLCLEAYGTNNINGHRYLTVRNLSTQALTTSVTFNVARWSYPGAAWLRLTNLYDGGSYTINLAAGSNSMPISLQGNECRAYATQVNPARPRILSNEGSFGIHTNHFEFDVGALPGQTITVETSTNLTQWSDILSGAVPDEGLFHFTTPSPVTLFHRYFRVRSP